MSLFEREQKIITIKKELQKLYQKQHKLGQVGGARELFLTHSQQLMDDLDEQSSQEKYKPKLDLIKHERARIKQYQKDNFFLY